MLARWQQPSQHHQAFSQHVRARGIPVVGLWSAAWDSTTTLATTAMELAAAASKLRCATAPHRWEARFWLSGAAAGEEGESPFW